MFENCFLKKCQGDLVGGRGQKAESKRNGDYMKKIGIVICNYNKEQEVLECIQCVLESKFTDFDLYVVDNGSTDHSVERIRENMQMK